MNPHQVNALFEVLSLDTGLLGAIFTVMIVRLFLGRM